MATMGEQVGGERKKGTWLVLAYLLLVVVAGLSVWGLANNLSFTEQESRDGLWDLREVDFDAGSVRLSGAVEYVPYALLSPEAFGGSDNILFGEVPDGTEYLTSRVRMRMPTDGYYEIAGFVADFGSRIFVNGVFLTDSGLPAETKDENVPAERFLRFTARAEGGVIEIVQQSSNFVFRNNQNHTGWTVGLSGEIERWAAGFSYTYVINMGFYVALFLVHLLLLLMMPSYRANLWFALLCLAWAVRTGITSVRPLVTLLSGADWTIGFRVEYLTVLSALVLIVLAYHRIFPGILPKWLRYTVYISQSIFAVIYLFCDTLFMSQTMIFYEIVAAFCAAFALVRLGMGVRKPDLKQKIIIISLFLIFTALLLDSLYYNGVFLPFIHNVVMESTIVIFSFFQMTAMVLGTMEEIAAVREAEQRLSAENAALDRAHTLNKEMIANLTHEMRTPLTVMSAYAQLAVSGLRQGRVNERTVEDLSTISQEAKRLADMASGVLEITGRRVQGEQVRRVQLEPVIRQITGLFQAQMQKQGNRLDIQITPPLAPARIDANELTQVLWNLIANANAHTRNGQITVSAALADDSLVLSVGDTGDGIAPDLLPFVFERSRSGAEGGSGLGLAICREIIERCGGEISIDSTQGKGTTVQFTLIADERRDGDA